MAVAVIKAMERTEFEDGFTWRDQLMASSLCLVNIRNVFIGLRESVYTGIPLEVEEVKNQMFQASAKVLSLIPSTIADMVLEFELALRR